MAPDTLKPNPDLDTDVRAAIIAAADEVDVSGYYISGDAGDLVAAITPLIWNAALAAASTAIADGVYVGRFIHSTPAVAARDARDEALAAVRHLTKPTRTRSSGL